MADDMIHKPPHYTSGAVETIDKIELIAHNLEANGVNAVTIVRISHALKYFDRVGLKGDAQDDLAKCSNYLCRALTGHWAGE